ncbi:hypothetical protein SAMN05421870_11710 [Streptomyces qinglanensis]|uniref:Uncharacterized protein n=1 Tax=Streptomyces qinglanensis TaxID=943816 RepID=A0A1H9WDJ5_9ACTN|nr:hypothetical protein SAMN05421870_11710 [Streptomyces qinglanensis]
MEREHRGLGVFLVRTGERPRPCRSEARCSRCPCPPRGVAGARQARAGRRVVAGVERPESCSPDDRHLRPRADRVPGEVREPVQEVQDAPSVCDLVLDGRQAGGLGQWFQLGHGDVRCRLAAFGARPSESQRGGAGPRSGVLRSWALPRLLTRWAPSDARRTVRRTPARLFGARLIRDPEHPVSTAPARIPAHGLADNRRATAIAVSPTGQAMPEFRGSEHIAGPRKRYRGASRGSRGNGQRISVRRRMSWPRRNGWSMTASPRQSSSGS